MLSESAKAHLSVSRRIYAQSLARCYVTFGAALRMSPVEYLHSKLDVATLRLRDRYWIERYNEVVDFYLAEVAALGAPNWVVVQA